MGDTLSSLKLASHTLPGVIVENTISLGIERSSSVGFPINEGTAAADDDDDAMVLADKDEEEVKERAAEKLGKVVGLGGSLRPGLEVVSVERGKKGGGERDLID